MVEGLERFLHKAYLGQKRFSIEGLDTMVPMLDQLLAGAGAAGARDVVIGMAHRGRLNVLAHIVGVSYEAILAEFEAGRGGTDALVPKGGLDDVKYHLGADGTYAARGEGAARHRLPQPQPPRGRSTRWSRAMPAPSRRIGAAQPHPSTRTAPSRS